MNHVSKHGVRPPAVVWSRAELDTPPASLRARVVLLASGSVEVESLAFGYVCDNESLCGCLVPNFNSFGLVRASHAALRSKASMLASVASGGLGGPGLLVWHGGAPFVDGREKTASGAAWWVD
jgi:hypothetical protein